MSTRKEPTCEQRISAEMESTLEDLRKLWTAYCEDDEDRHADDLGTFHEYGLSFDYVAAGTFEDQDQGYFRYQISYGGPSDEFRFFCDAERKCYKVQYWFLDWWDGAHRNLRGEDRSLLMEIFDFFDECGSVQAEIEKAQS